MYGTITIFTSGNKAVIGGIQPKLQARVFAEGVRARIRQPKADIAANAKQPSDLDDLERLAALKRKVSSLKRNSRPRNDRSLESHNGRDGADQVSHNCRRTK